jgi:UDP-N-acetylmuramate dehydrogenase
MLSKSICDLKRHCSLKIGGYAEEVVIPISEEELMALYSEVKATKRKHFLIGKGSNLLFLDSGFDGLIIKNTRACSDLALLEGRFGLLRNRRRIYVGSSVPNQKLIKFCGEANLEAPTYLQSVPGNIGGAIYMNAGTGITEGLYFSDFICRVRVFDGRRVYYLPVQDCEFEYRRSRFMHSDLLILGCEIECQRRSGKKTRQDALDRIQFAKETQDDSYPNAGSVFNRGFKDIKSIRSMREGGARFSEKTCNWIINDKNASSDDVLKLMERAIAEHHAAGLDTPEQEWIIVK